MASILFIVNPISGRGTRKSRIIRKLADKGCKVVFTEYAGHGRILAAEAAEDIVVAVGGDGTVNEVAQGALEGGKILGIIPCGSGNGLANHLGLNCGLKRGLEIIEKGETVGLDHGEIDGRPFFSVSGVGFDSLVSKGFAESGSRGLLTYAKVALKLWFGFKCERFEIEVDGVHYDDEVTAVIVSNSNQWGSHFVVAAPAEAGDGLLDVSIAGKFHTVNIPRLVFDSLTHRLHKNRFMHHIQGKSIVVTRPESGPAHFDGDYFEAGKRVEIRIMPGQLRVLAPGGRHF